MELLVVMTIIALLVAMLLPTIRMVRESALSVRCLAHLRQFALASDAYASDNRGSLAPCSDAQLASDGSGAWWGGQCYWPTLLTPYLGSNPDYNGSTPSYNGSITSKNLAWGCPGWRGRNYSGTNYATTSSGYGYNKYPGLPTTNKASSLGVVEKIYKRAGIENAGSRLMFSDANDWHVYSAPSSTNFPTKGVDSTWAGTGGMRHRNGINILFFDGHAATVPLAKAADTFDNPAIFQQ